MDGAYINSEPLSGEMAKDAIFMLSQCQIRGDQAARFLEILVSLSRVADGVDQVQPEAKT